WTFSASGSTRGVEYWPGDGTHPAQIVFHGNGGFVSLNAKTGQPNPAFGTGGLLTGGAGGGGGGSSPPIIYKNVLISGGPNPYGDGRNGAIRGFDVVSGKQLWRFNTVPEKGEPGYETWAPGSAEKQTSVHVWGI